MGAAPLVVLPPCAATRALAPANARKAGLRAESRAWATAQSHAQFGTAHEPANTTLAAAATAVIVASSGSGSRSDLLVFEPDFSTQSNPSATSRYAPRVSARRDVHVGVQPLPHPYGALARGARPQSGFRAVDAATATFRTARTRG